MPRTAPSAVAIVAADWEVLRDAFPGTSDDELRGLVLTHARIVAAAQTDQGPEIAFARRVAEVAADRLLVAVGSDRLRVLVPAEREANAELVRLRTEDVARLKLRAKELRRTIRALERDARARGIDPSTVEPRIGDDAISVDGYEGPGYGSNDDRRRAVAEFFGREAAG